jgi:predicted RNA-binding protein YlxR (DUF448 family)
MLADPQHEALDAGPTSRASGSERYCIATRTVRSVDELIRFVVGPDGAVVPDVKRKLPGRGVWITAQRAAISDAVKRRAFIRGFKSEVQVAPDLADRTERLLERAALDALAIAGKAGQVLAGFGKVEAALARDNVIGTLHAADAAADGIGKIDALRRRRGEAGLSEIAVIRAFTSAQLDLALGRSNVVHAALLAGPAGNTFLARCERLMRFRTGNPDDLDRRHAPPGHDAGRVGSE